jgi:hypothetical protein
MVILELPAGIFTLLSPLVIKDPELATMPVRDAPFP